MASRKTIFPGLAELGLEPRVKRHMENALSPDRKQSKVYAAAASYKTHNYIYIYVKGSGDLKQNNWQSNAGMSQLLSLITSRQNFRSGTASHFSHQNHQCSVDTVDTYAAGEMKRENHAGFLRTCTTELSPE